MPKIRYSVSGKNSKISGALFNKKTILAVLPPVIYSVGDTGPGGGTIYYDAGSQQSWGRWLEYAPNGWYDGIQDPGMSYGINVTPKIDSLATIGSGLSNTAAMFAADPDTSRAGGATTSYSSNTKSDWFLPSTDELIALVNYVKNNSVTGFRQDGYGMYWGSEDITGGHAHSVFFSDSSAVFQPKIVDYYVRPIRYVS